MVKFYRKQPTNYDYWRNPKEGFPQRIYWRIVAGNRKLDILEESELIFDDRDLKIRQITEHDLKIRKLI